MEDHVVLYRQYRPLTFDDVVGQEAAVGALRQSVIAKKLAHAYLFCGQHGTGKTTIAKIFARAVNCEHPVNGNPCNECPTCKGILDGSILDVTEMDAASNNGVDDIRPILQEVNFAPTRTTYKVYIIDEVHMLSKGAFNALLKTIEEPPKHVIFLFATTESDKIPATIISRCQRYDFKRIPIDLISGRLREVCGKSGIKASEDALRLIASRSDGALRDALSLLDQISAISGGDKEISSQDVERITGTVDSSFLFKMANCLIDARFDELIDLCEILNNSGKNQVRFTLDLASYFRDLLIIRVKADPVIYLPYPKETIKDMYQTAAKVSADTLTGYISYLSKEYAELRKSPDIATSFELMLMRLCGRKSSLPVTPIVIPDFEKKQAEKAKEITLSDTTPSYESKKDEAVSETEAAPVKSEEPEEKPADEAHKDESKPAFTAPEPYRPKPSAAPAPYRPQPSSAPSSVLSFTAATKETSAEDAKPSVESVFAVKKDEPSVPAPAEPEDEPSDDPDDAYIPATDPADEPDEPTIFSYIPEEPEAQLSFGLDDPDEPSAPSSYENEGPAKGIFSGLSSSFLADLAGDLDVKEPEPEEPQRTVPEKPRSQLVAQTERSGLIVDGPSKDSVRAPSFTGEDADLAVRWNSVTSKLHGTNENIAVILERTKLRKEGDSAYVVFEDNDMKLLSNLKNSQSFRQISASIKDEFGADHLYLCTVTQYSNQEKKNRASEQDRKLDSLSERSANMGVPTDVHFGD
ncbi:MAG: DNA polymerase III subunit gamma/tau [Clostridiales bacterium]|nr:DNA polymerase III subunit gamma/tau [Clostridiales bacterium]